MRFPTVIIAAVCLSGLLILPLSACGEKTSASAPSAANVVWSDTAAMLMQDAGGLPEYRSDPRWKKLFQLTEGLEYLKKKYPDHTFQFLHYNPATVYTPWATVTFQEEGDEIFELTVTSVTDGFVCKDTYYGAVLRQSYDNYVEETLLDRGYSVTAYTTFSSPMGTEVGEDTSIDELIEIKPEPLRVTHLFMNSETDLNELAAAMLEPIKEAKLYGTYILYAVPEETNNDALSLEASRMSFESVVFSNFG